MIEMEAAQSDHEARPLRLARGLYNLPKVQPQFGLLAPTPDDVAQAPARETGSQVQIAGARGANALGLSIQVPAKSTYLTDGRPMARPVVSCWANASLICVMPRLSV